MGTLSTAGPGLGRAVDLFTSSQRRESRTSLFVVTPCALAWFSLEERLGVRLLQRSTRHFSVTEVGQSYYQHCKAMLVEAEAAQEAVEMTRAEPRGVVRMSCPVALLHAHVGRMLAEFMAAHPHVTVQLEATNRSVSPLSDGIDLAIRVRPPPLPDSELVLRVLSDRGQSLVVSPALLAAHGTPAGPAGLADFPSLSLGPPQDEHIWTLFGPGGAKAEIRHHPRLITSDMVALRRAALAGIHVVYPSRRGLLPAVRGLIDYLAQAFAEVDED